jgi:hypothetical protein
LDLKAVLEDSIGKDFELVDAKLGSASGKLWWFKDKTFAAHWPPCRLGGVSREYRRPRREPNPGAQAKMTCWAANPTRKSPVC